MQDAYTILCIRKGDGSYENYNPNPYRGNYRTMRKLIISEFITLDGVMEDPGGAEEFEYGGWSLDYFNDEYLKFKYDELVAADALLLGRKTYEIFADAWPSHADSKSFANAMNSMPKYVVSRKLKKLAWKNSIIIKGDLTKEIGDLKKQPGKNILVLGSAQLVRTLLQLNLVDEMHLMIHPIILGKGKRLFESLPGSRSLKLKKAVAFSSGIVVFSYLSMPVKETREFYVGVR